LSCGWRRLEPIRVEWNIPSVGEIVGAFLWSEAIEHVAVQGLRNVGELIAIVREDGDTRLLDVARQVLQVLATDPDGGCSAGAAAAGLAQRLSRSVRAIARRRQFPRHVVAAPAPRPGRHTVSNRINEHRRDDRYSIGQFLGGHHPAIVLDTMTSGLRPTNSSACCGMRVTSPSA
jgi:hypothetical protein